MSVLKYKDTDGQWKPLQNASANEGVHVGPNQPTGRENIWINPDEQPPSFQLPADYIVEQGTEGIWHWEKWNNGKAVCYASEIEERHSTVSWGNGVFADCSPLNFPTNLFAVAPYYVNAFQTLYDGGFFGYNGSGRLTKDAWTGFGYFRMDTKTSVHVHYCAIAIGRWK